MIDSFTIQQKIYLQKLLVNNQSLHTTQKIINQTNNTYQRQIENGGFQIKHNSYPSNVNINLNEVKRVNQNNLQSRSSHSQHNYNININRNTKETKIFTQEQRQQFLRKIKKQQQDLRRVRQQQIKLKQHKRKAQIQQKEREQLQKKEVKKKQIQKRLQELGQQQLKRQAKIKISNKQFQQISKKKILLHRLQDNYKQSQLQNLKERNQQLNKIRQKHRPITKSDFDQHLIRIDQYLQKKQNTKDILKQETIDPLNKKQIYKSRWYKQIINQEKSNQSLEQQQRKQIMKKLKERGKQYSQFIRVYHPPSIDQKLIQELQKRQDKPIERKKAKQIRQMGLNNLKYSKKITISKEEAQVKNKKLNSNQEYPKRYKDYLQDFKTNRRSNSLQQLFLEKTKESIPRQKIQYLAQRLQQKALQNQKLHKIRKQVLGQDVNQMYMIALNAKLNLLGK